MNPLPPPSRGLASAEARDRLARTGANELTATEASGWLQALRGVATEPMFLLLVGAAAVYLVLGDLGEGLLLSAFAAASVGLVVVQDRRSGRALDALRALSVPQVRVLRDGRLRRVPSRELVPGDWVAVGEGDRVPADAAVRECSGLTVDESLLTGESVPVGKRTLRDGEAGADTTPGGDDMPWLFSGTLVVAGHGFAEVTATGAATRAGAIGTSLAAISQAPTPLQQQLRKLVGWLGTAALGLSLLIVAWYGVTRGDWMQGILSGITAAMGMLPQEFPMALAVFLALGAWRLARARVLARRPAVIEALGGTTVLCVDKTGTLTENRMRLRRLVTPQAEADLAPGEALPEGLHELLEHAALASQREGTEPMDSAIVREADAALAGSPHLHPGWRREKEYPLRRELLAVAHAWAPPDGRRHVAAKGAPEAVIALCHLDAAQAAAVVAQVERLAEDGLRVLGVASARSAGGAPAPEELHDYDFRWLGLAAFEDPLRAGVAQAVQEARAAGIAVVMVTGDHARTGVAIARQAGLDVSAGALTGEDVARLDDAQLRETVRRVRVFARVQPEQKLRLVQAFAGNGEVVAMTGDGVNDAPALKAAHIGIAMGARGTDVAREAAAVVLLDEDFGHIVEGVRMGRRIFDNLRKVMTYITAVHVPIAGVAVLPVLLGWPPMLMPAHVVLIQMMIDPVCSLAFEGAPAAPGLMQRPPRRSHEALVGGPMLWRGAVQGGFVFLAVLALYGAALRTGTPDLARSEAVIALVAGNLGLVWLNASLGVGWRAVFSGGYLAFWAVAAAATAVLALGLALPSARELLAFALPGPGAIAAAVAAGIAGVIAAGAAMALARRLP